ncbi:ECF transporter S component [Candidatus Bathyarchaeota archaeon]|nr:ECF transporter S component [Candidatus Bathyarchaeota archaeon]
MRRAKSIMVATASMLGAVSGLLSLMKVSIPFPILPYLKIDFAEIPDFLALMVLGPVGGGLTATVHFAVILARSGNLFSASMKYIAVLSTMVGFIVARPLVEKMRFKGNPKNIFIAGLSLASLSRIAVMTVLNLLMFTILFPNYLIFAKKTLEAFGLEITSDLEALYYALAFTGLYNLINTVVAVVPALLILKALKTFLEKSYKQPVWIYSEPKKQGRS